MKGELVRPHTENLEEEYDIIIIVPIIPIIFVGEEIIWNGM